MVKAKEAVDVSDSKGNKRVFDQFFDLHRAKVG